MYEPHHQKPIPRLHFVRRLIMHSLGSLGLIVVSIFLGMLGYHYYEGLPWLDAFLNAAMLLGGMGPVESPQTEGGKLFAGLYALYAGLVFLIAASLVVAPALHRMVHLFHWEEKKKS
ncbi:MAG: hypothetical protein ACKVRP_06515 [Bacteroidota bacterium]